MNNKKTFIKNITIVVLGLLFFVLIIKFFPVVSNPDYQNTKKEEISDNFKAEALKYEGKTTEETETKLSEEEQKVVDEKAVSEQPKEEVKTEVISEIPTKESSPVSEISLPKKSGSSTSSNISTTSMIVTTNIAPKFTPTNMAPNPTTITPPEPLIITPPEPLIITPLEPLTNTPPEPLIITPLEPVTDINIEISEDDTNTREEVQSSDANIIENNSKDLNSGSSDSGSGSRPTSGYVPGILIGQQVSEKINKVVDMLPSPIQEKIENVSKTATVATVKAAEVVASSTGQTVTVAVTSAGAVAGASISASAAMSLNALVVSDSLFGIIRLWGVLLSALGLRKRNKPWGSVYDSVTKRPLDPVYVSLENNEGEEVASAITDLDGRYGFLVQTGKYKLNVHKANYEFPSKKAIGKNTDQIYTNLYFGETIEISNDGEVVTKNIPMDAIKFDWNEFEKNRRKLMKFYSRRNVLFAMVADILFSLGLLITIISTITVPRVYNIIILVIYIILYIVRGFAIKPKSYGSIIEKDGGSPLSFGIIHVKKSSDEIVHKVADKIGRFYCLIPNGIYEISIDKKISDEEYVEIYKEDGYEVKNGHINKKFQV